MSKELTSRETATRDVIVTESGKDISWCLFDGQTFEEVKLECHGSLLGVVASDAFGARSSVADGVTAIGARRRSSKRGVRLLLEADSEKRFSGTANETETSAEVSDGPSDDSERDESDIGSPRRDAAADDSDADASTDTYSVSDVSDVSTPSVTDSDVDEDEAGRLYLTSSGVAAGGDAALALIARLAGDGEAEKVATAAEWTWHRDADADPFATE